MNTWWFYDPAGISAYPLRQREDVTLGKSIYYEGLIKLYYSGLHGCPTILDALDYGFNSTLHFANLYNIQNAKCSYCYVGDRRIVLATVDMNMALRDAAAMALKKLEAYLSHKWSNSSSRYKQDVQDLSHARAMGSGIYVPECAARGCVERMVSTMDEVTGGLAQLEIENYLRTYFFCAHCHS